MPTTNGEPDLADLAAWQAALEQRAAELRSQIAERQAELSSVEERFTLVTKLIEVAARGQPDRSRSKAEEETKSSPPTFNLEASGPTVELEDAVEEILRATGEPLHISQIREALVTNGVPIPGRGDDANIIVRLRRFQNRFTRTARGTYGLAEWGIPEFKTATRRKRRTPAR